MTRRPRLAVLSSHPVQYYAPIFRELAKSVDLHVFYSFKATADQQAAAGFNHAFEWDIDLISGYNSSFLKNVSKDPGAGGFKSCDTPEISDRLKEGGFSCVLTLGWHLKSLVQGVWAAKRQGIPVMVRGDSQLTTPRRLALKLAKRAAYPLLLRTFDAALYVGVRNRDYFLHYGFPSARLFHSPHCIETDRFETGATDEARAALRGKLGVPDDETVLLFAGKLIPFKQPQRVVEAAGELLRAGRRVSVMVAGSGPLYEPMVATASKLGVPLRYLGFQNQTEMPSAYAASDVLVLPSTGQETWGLVCNEALASGRPIVVSDQVGCAPDLASDGVAGRTFPMGDSSALAAVVAQTIDNPPGRAAIRSRSQRHSVSAACSGILAGMNACAPLAEAPNYAETS
jgi:glycosyltransferase involved in cell wall biosynthesis